jgi:putative membrane protein
MMDGGMGGGWVMMVLGFLLFILVLGAVVAGVVYLVRGFSKPTDSGSAAQSGDSGSAQRMLDERYARGEIDKDEYEERRRNLNG